MKLLLDTCTFLWLITEDINLSDAARELFQEPANDVYLSVVSTWEIVLKHAWGKLPLPLAPEYLVPEQRELHGIDTLPLNEPAMFHLPRLPTLHRDPFDRMLICQAIEHSLVILTPDDMITQYPVRTQW